MCPDVVVIGTVTLLRSGVNALGGEAALPIPASPSEKRDVAEDVVEWCALTEIN